MSAPDLFALGGCAENSDPEILVLFRRWLDESGVADAVEGDEDAFEEAVDRRAEIEEQIVALRAGPIGLAIKVYLYVRVECSDWTPRLAAIRYKPLFDAGGIGLGERAMVSVLRDAAALVPEIGDYAEAILHDDAALIDAEMDVQWTTTVLAEPDPSERPGRRAEIHKVWRDACSRAAAIEAKTPRGAAIKTRLANAPEPP